MTPALLGVVEEGEGKGEGGSGGTSRKVPRKHLPPLGRKLAGAL